MKTQCFRKEYWELMIVHFKSRKESPLIKDQI